MMQLYNNYLIASYFFPLNIAVVIMKQSSVMEMKISPVPQVMRFSEIVI